MLEKCIFSNMIYDAMKANVTDEVNKIKFIDSDYYEKFVLAIFYTCVYSKRQEKKLSCHYAGSHFFSVKVCESVYFLIVYHSGETESAEMLMFELCKT